MPWIQQVPVDQATGRLKRHFDAGIQRAGRVWNIVRIMSLNPRALETSMALYSTVMRGPSPLTTTQRELLATVVSAELDCHY